ncbi:MAG: hypothetical protein O2819_09155 [Planctomycetota bacterium]|nr:hypothetical protein [Planctomycetota bacterium]MDA1106197.1 hypothetical protein [Planctomycetota bacterium]
MSDNTGPDFQSPHHDAIELERLLAEELELGNANPTRAADSIVVHAMLSLLAPGDAQRTQRRVTSVMAVIRAQARERWQLRRWAKRASAAAVLVAATLAIAIVVFQVEETSADATLSRMMDTAAALSNRTYAVAIRRNNHEYGIESRASLVLGEGNRFVFAFDDPIPNGGRGGRAPMGQAMPQGAGQPGHFLPTVGFDGEAFFAEMPGKRYFRSQDAGPLRMLLAASGGDDDDGADILTLESVMERLRRGYDLTMTRGADSQTGLSTINIVATRQGGATEAGSRGSMRQAGDRTGDRGGDRASDRGNNRGSDRSREPIRHRGMDFGVGDAPSSVRISADAHSFEVLSMKIDWLTPDGSLTRQVEINRGAAHHYGAEWFTPASRGLREADPSQLRGSRGRADGDRPDGGRPDGNRPPGGRPDGGPSDGAPAKAPAGG